MAVIENETARRIAHKVSMKGGPDGARALADAEQDRDALLIAIEKMEAEFAEDLAEARAAGDAAYGDLSDEYDALKEEKEALEKELKTLREGMDDLRLVVERGAREIMVHLEYKAYKAAERALKDLVEIARG